MFSGKQRVFLFGTLGLTGVMLAAACSDHNATPTEATAPLGAPSLTTHPMSASQHAAWKAQEMDVQEKLARAVAVALRNPEVRSYIKAGLDASPFREHKLQFQQLLDQDSGRLAQLVARANGMPRSGLEELAQSAMGLEIYFPFHEQRTQWQGDENIQVGTVIEDEDQGIVYATNGRRTVVDQNVRPATPTLVIVPVETDFNRVHTDQTCIPDDENPCGGGGGGGGGITPDITTLSGLHLTEMWTDGDYEGGFKGSPEFEIHVMGQKGGSDSLTSYQCVGADAGSPYYFDMNSTHWTGNALVFSQTQLNNYKTAHANQNVRLFVVEDDDTGCQLKLDGNRAKQMFNTLDSLYKHRTGAKDTTRTVAGVITKSLKDGETIINIIEQAASFITTADDIVGNGIEDDVVQQYDPAYNWFVKQDNTTVHGKLHLEMK